MSRAPKKGKRPGTGSATKRTATAVEKKFGPAARKAAERGGRKPTTWAQPDRMALRDAARSAPPVDDAPSDDLDIEVSRSIGQTERSRLYRICIEQFGKMHFAVYTESGTLFSETQ